MTWTSYVSSSQARKRSRAGDRLRASSFARRDASYSSGRRRMLKDVHRSRRCDGGMTASVNGETIARDHTLRALLPRASIEPSVGRFLLAQAAEVDSLAIDAA